MNSAESVTSQIEAVVRQYIKNYGALEGMTKDVFIDPLYYQQWAAAVKAPFSNGACPTEIEMFLADIEDGFLYVQQLLASTVSSKEAPSTSTNPLRMANIFSSLPKNNSVSSNFLELPTQVNDQEEEEEEEPAEYEFDEDEDDNVTVPPIPLNLHQMSSTIKPFYSMSVDDQLAVRAATVCQVLQQFVGSSLMSGFEFVPTRVVQLLPGLLEEKPAAQSEEFNTAVWCLAQMMAYLGVHSIDAELNVVSFDEHGKPVRYGMLDANFPLGELYAKWR